MADVAAEALAQPAAPGGSEDAQPPPGARTPSNGRTARALPRRLERSDLEYELVCQTAAEALERDSVLLQYAVAHCESQTATRVRMLRYLVGETHLPTGGSAPPPPEAAAAPEVVETCPEDGNQG